MPISRKNLIKKRTNSIRNQSKQRRLSNKSKFTVRGGMKINVKKLDQTIIPVDVDENDTFRTLKQKIESIMGIPVDRQRLIFAGFQVQDEQMLIHYNIREGNTIHVIIKSGHNNASYTPELILPKHELIK